VSALLAFLLGLLFGPRVRLEVDTGRQPPPRPGTGEPTSPPILTPPQPWSEEPPAPPPGWQRHPEPIPESARARAAELSPRLWAIGPGTRGGPELRDWRGDGRPYPILFRADEYRAERLVGIYVEQAATQPPPQPAPPAPVKPMPGGWKAHPAPIPASVVSRAWSLLPSLWTQGEGSYRIESQAWAPNMQPYDVLFRSERHAGNKKGVTAYVRSTWKPSPFEPGTIQV
jgi:hypothetical protein